LRPGGSGGAKSANRCVLTADEVEARETRAALLEEVRECPLAALELVDHPYTPFFEVRENGSISEPDDLGVGLELRHDFA
jgi:hypothetical protein